MTVQRIDHPYQPGGGNNKDNLFVLLLLPKPDAKYSLRANVRSDVARTSSGDIYVVPAD